MKRYTINGTGRKKSYGCDLEKEEKLDWSYTQRRKPSEGGDRGLDDRKKTEGKETIGYAERVSERIVVCGTKEKGGKQERVENMEAKNLPHGRTLTTMTQKRSEPSHGQRKGPERDVKFEGVGHQKGLQLKGKIIPC